MPRYNDNKTHDSNSSVMCPKSTGQLSRRGAPASLITFRYGVQECTSTDQDTVSDSLFQSLTPTVSMGRLCDTFGPLEICSRKIIEDMITRRLEKGMHNSKFSKLFPDVTRLPFP